MASRLLVGSASAVLAIGALATGATAQVPDFDMHWQVGPNGSDFDLHYNWDLHGNEPLYGSHTVPMNSKNWTGWKFDGVLGAGQLVPPPGNPGGEPVPIWVLAWNCVFEDDTSTTEALGPGGAFVTANIVVTNNSAVTQNFGLTMTLPVGIIGPPLFERGSATGTVTDQTFDDATVFSPVGGQIYTPKIDGVAEAAGLLLPIGGGGGFSQSAGGPFLSAGVGPQDFGHPVAVAANAAQVNATIAITLSFALTAGDSASFTSIFEVLVPGPAGLPVLALGGLMIGRRRRRS